VKKIKIAILLIFIACAQPKAPDPLEDLSKQSNLIAFGEVKNIEVTEVGEATDATETLMPATAGTIEIDAEEVLKGHQERAISMSFAVAGAAPLEPGEKAVVFALGSADRFEIIAALRTGGYGRVYLWNGISAETQSIDTSVTECLVRIRKYVGIKK
jgi:hypothetical protein